MNVVCVCVCIRVCLCFMHVSCMITCAYMHVEAKGECQGAHICCEIEYLLNYVNVLHLFMLQ